jgi:hypothetical protein
MGSMVCKLGVFVMVILWIILSLTIPFLGGSLGDMIFRSSTGLSLEYKPYTYVISTMPIFGPLISTFILVA